MATMRGTMRFYTCPKCGRLLVTDSHGGPMAHECESIYCDGCGAEPNEECRWHCLSWETE